MTINFSESIKKKEISNMRRLLVLLAFIAMTSTAIAQNKSFTIGSDNNTVIYAYKFDGKSFILLGYQEDDNYLQEKAILKFKFGDGKTLRLEGEECAYYMVPKIGFEGRILQSGLIYRTRFYRFPINQQQIEMFNGSLIKIQLNTIPNMLNCEVTNENFGKRFYESFQNQKDDF